VENENVSETHKLVKEFSQYKEFKKELIENKFNKKTIKAFKKYYDPMHLDLIEYIKKHKDKKFSNIARELKTSRQLFGKMYKWIGIQAMVMVFPTAALINLWFLDFNKYVLSFGFLLNAIAVFIIIRKVQSIPAEIKIDVETNDQVCTKIIKILKEKK